MVVLQLITLSVVTVVTGILLVRLQTSHVRGVAVERRNILASVRDVLERPQLAQCGIDYPVLTGEYRGAPVTVSVIVDTVALRHLPTLWLSVSRRQPLPLTGPVDILLRPSVTDIVSPGERFPVEHPVPPTWPAFIRVATPPGGGGPDFSALSAALPLLHDKRTKDVLLAPAGARVVVELARAELGHYRLFKRSKFNVALSVGQLTAVLDALCAMTEGIQSTAVREQSPHR